MKTGLRIAGLTALLIGFLWIGQGTGIVSWPASSFMIGRQTWVTYGAALAVLGVVLILWSRRLRT